MSFPASLVVIQTSRLETAKWTTARVPNPNSGVAFGLRSRYCFFAWPMDWVESVFSSIVATGRPLTNSTRSTDWLVAGLKCT